MTSMYRHECRCKEYIENSQTRGWRKSVPERKSIAYKTLAEKPRFEECKNYSDDGVWRGNYRGVEAGSKAEEESWRLCKPY